MSWLTRWMAARSRSKNVMGINRRNLALVRKLNARRDFPLADDKVLAKDFMLEHGIPIPPTLAVYDSNIGLRRFPEELDATNFVVKPARGRGGSGILVIGTHEGQRVLPGGRVVTEEHIRRHAAQIIFGAYSLGMDDRALVEERLVTDPAIANLSPGGLPDFRVLLVRGVPRMAMLRLATLATGGRANLHQGGIGVGIDLTNGRTVKGIMAGHLLEVHPDTGADLVGVPIPYFKEMLQISKALAAAVPLGFLGVDITLDARLGPVVLEFNARPGLEIQAANGLGLRQILEES